MLLQFSGKYCKIKHLINLRRAVMKKILTLSLVLLLLFSGVCFAEKSKLKKNTWTPVQTRTDNSVDVQDFYNHRKCITKAINRLACGSSRLFLTRKARHIPIFMKRLSWITQRGDTELSALTRQTRRIKKSRHRISILWMRNGKALPEQSMKRCITE